MSKRKPITKKIRFEVFKRDSFTCQYCGNTPPAVTLEIDHLNPISKGGNNNINNLITACFDCNRGKSNIPLERIPNQLIENYEILKERENQLKEYNKLISKIESRLTRQINIIDLIFQETFPDRGLTEQFKHVSVKQFLNKLPLNEVKDAMSKACSYIDKPNDATRYFCGICWNRIKNKGVDYR